MPEVLNIGPFLIKWEWLVIAIALLIGYNIMIYKLKHQLPNARKIGDIYYNAGAIVLLSWKFAPIILNPSIVLSDWRNILFITGTKNHIFIGIIIAVVYSFFQSRKYKISFWAIVDALPFILLPTLIIYHAFIFEYGTQTDIIWGVTAENPDYSYHPINFYKLILYLLSLVFLWRARFKFGTGIFVSYFLVLYGLSLIIVSFFQPQLLIFGGLSLAQIKSIFLILIGLLVKTLKKDAYTLE